MLQLRVTWLRGRCGLVSELWSACRPTPDGAKAHVAISQAIMELRNFLLSESTKATPSSSVAADGSEAKKRPKALCPQLLSLPQLQRRPSLGSQHR